MKRLVATDRASALADAIGRALDTTPIVAGEDWPAPVPDAIEALVLVGNPRPAGRLTTLSLKAVQQAIAAQIALPWLGARAALTAFKEAGRAGSVTLVQETAPDALGFPEAATALMRAVALEAGGAPIRANLVTVSPPATPEEAATLVAYLASAAAGFVTGTTFRLGAA